MRPVRLARLAALVGALLVGAPAASAGGVAPRYLALGDSLALSIQTHPDGHHYRTRRGYAEYVLRNQRARYPDLQLVKLGRGGATAWQMLHDKGRLGITQVNQAVKEIRDHRVAVITIDIGAWEVERCRSGSTWPAGCTRRAFQSIDRDVPAIVRRLRAAAGARNIPIVGVDYYNFFLSYWRSGRAGRAIARHSVAVEHRISRQLLRAYRSVHVPVADVEGAFDSLAIQRFVDSRRWGHLPLAVERICNWTFGCSVPHDDHANSRGYRVMGRATVQTLNDLEETKIDPTTGGVS